MPPFGHGSPPRNRMTALKGEYVKGEHTCRFVIRARREPREIPGAAPEWRFWIEHLPGGEQHHYRAFAEVLHFIAGYLPEQALLTERTANEP